MNYIYSIILFISMAILSQPIQEDMILVEGNDEIKSFYLDKREVTLFEYAEFVKATGHKTYCEKRDSGIVFNPFYKIVQGVNWRHDLVGKPIPIDQYKVLPVSRLTRKDIEAYAKWVGKRIPTKEEWVFAAKGGNATKGYKYIGGNNPRKCNWFDTNARERRQPVASLKPNELGLYDMGGNVSELVIRKEDDKAEFMGGSFFEDKDMLESNDLKHGWQGSKETLNIPYSGFRCAKSL